MKVLFSYTVQALGIASILPFASSAYTRRRFNVGQEVNTTSGLVQGHAAANRSQVSEYLGIPFAQPPVGDLRFAAPKAYRSSARFNASSLGLACVSSETQYNFSILTEDGYHLSSTAEQYFNTISGNGVARGEDCLQLNVWTKPQAGEKAKAVLLWIHGGGTCHCSNVSTNFLVSVLLTTGIFRIPGWLLWRSVHDGPVPRR